MAFSLVFTAYLSNAVLSGKSPNNFQVEAVGIALGHLVACSARISVDTHTHTHTHTDRQTDRQTERPSLRIRAEG